METTEAGFSTPYQVLDLNSETIQPTVAPTTPSQQTSEKSSDIDTSSFVEPSNDSEWQEVKNYHTIQKEKNMNLEQENSQEISLGRK